MSKIEEAISIIAALGFPRAQQNERSALSLLALIQLRENGSWNTLLNPLVGVRAILDFCRNDYGKPYAENSRESFRKETLHQFVAAGMALQNPDNPARSPNSPKWCYQIAPRAKELLETYGTRKWKKSLANYMATVGSLAQSYKKERELALVPCRLPDGVLFRMSSGAHSELIRSVIEEFAPRFAHGAQVLYIGDTGNKGVVHDVATLEKVGIDVHKRGKMPDAILYLFWGHYTRLYSARSSLHQAGAIAPRPSSARSSLDLIHQDQIVGAPEGAPTAPLTPIQSCRAACSSRHRPPG